MGEMTKPLVAYSVQMDECGCIQFARSGAEARRKGAWQMDAEWEDIMSCRRAHDFDQFAPGPVPDEALWKSGWRFLCITCDASVCDDGLGHMIDGNPYCEEHTPAGRTALSKEEAGRG